MTAEKEHHPARKFRKPFSQIRRFGTVHLRLDGDYLTELTRPHLPQNLSHRRIAPVHIPGVKDLPALFHFPDKAFKIIKRQPARLFHVDVLSVLRRRFSIFCEIFLFRLDRHRLNRRVVQYFVNRHFAVPVETARLTGEILPLVFRKGVSGYFEYVGLIFQALKYVKPVAEPARAYLRDSDLTHLSCSNRTGQAGRTSPTQAVCISPVPPPANALRR